MPLKPTAQFLSSGETAKAALPYDANVSERASFLTIAIDGELVALPLMALGRAALRSDSASIVLEFSRNVVKIEGRRLDHLFDEILMCRVRLIRVGRHPICTVESIRIIQAAGICGSAG
jgi:hypothetical protein